MTANEKDAMALAVLDRIGTAPISETERGQVAEARDHLAARLAELEAAIERAAREVSQFRAVAERAELAEAELAAVRAFIANDSLAATFQTLGQYRTAALDAAREGKK